MKKINIITKNDDISILAKKDIINKLQDYFIIDEKNPNICLCIGGDGTLLSAINTYIDNIKDIQFLSIHSGTLGFFSDYILEEIDDCLNDLINNEGYITSYDLLQCTINNDIYYAVNDIRLESTPRTQIIDVYINDHYLETFRGNGLLVCTQLGSSAYNRSLKGAIIDHNLSCIQLTEISAINRRLYPTCESSIIFSKDTTITFKGNFNNTYLINDQCVHNINGSNTINIKLSNKQVNILRYKDIPYLERIKTLF